MANVYSYIRFSSLKQRSGSSIDRQLDYARRWAEANGMRLDETLTMRDEGLSAYHQRHVKQGALGAFLDAIRAGRIPSGSVLIVEGLDRLSRAEPILAQAQMAEIINADITVVTACDGKQYNREKLKSNPMDLVYSLLVMIRAHEESETKSQRAKAALKRHCEQWADGKVRARRLGRTPEWLRQNNGQWELIPERVAAIQYALTAFRRGLGHIRIADELLEAGMQLTASPPNSNQIYRIIRNPALKGAKVLQLDSESYEMPGYYPAIVSDAEFAELQVLMVQRAKTGGVSIRKIPGIITGMGIASCGYCGGPMAANNITSRTRADGTLSDGHRRITCTCYAERRTCPHPQSSSIVPIERTIVTYCADQMNLSALLDGSDREAPARARLAAARIEIADIEQKLGRVTEALIEAGDGVAPLVFIRKARELEEALAKAKQEGQAAEREVIANSQRSTPGLAEAWAALVNGVMTLDPDARMTARQLVFDTFERIVVFNRGFVPSANANEIGLVLVARGGGSRMLIIDRTTGIWKAGDHITQVASGSPRSP